MDGSAKLISSDGVCHAPMYGDPRNHTKWHETGAFLVLLSVVSWIVPVLVKGTRLLTSQFAISKNPSPKNPQR